MKQIMELAVFLLVAASCAMADTNVWACAAFAFAAIAVGEHLAHMKPEQREPEQRNAQFVMFDLKTGEEIR